VRDEAAAYGEELTIALELPQAVVL
jgi:hypothetical protein